MSLLLLGGSSRSLTVLLMATAEAQKARSSVQPEPRTSSTVGHPLPFTQPIPQHLPTRFSAASPSAVDQGLCPPPQACVGTWPPGNGIWRRGL